VADDSVAKSGFVACQEHSLLQLCN
jgi:hypothetical protein